MSDGYLYQAKVPSNIAFLKYWGKKDVKAQWPTNNSLSMTLSKAYTLTSAKKKSGREHTFYFENKLVKKESIFGKKIFTFLNFLQRELGFKESLSLRSSNNFPTASGIASSASGFGALTLASIAAWTDSKNILELLKNGFSLEYIAALSRMGSGSSCRSFFGGYVEWSVGKTPKHQCVSNLFPSSHWLLSNLIVIFSSKKKAVSSSDGHRSAVLSPLFPLRIASIEEKESHIRQAIKEKDIRSLGPLIEQEALDIHLLVMSSPLRVSYLSDQTIKFLVWIRQLRVEKKIHVYYTIDAGTNVHLICEPQVCRHVLSYIKESWNGVKVIQDGTGTGPTLSIQKSVIDD